METIFMGYLDTLSLSLLSIFIFIIIKTDSHFTNLHTYTRLMAIFPGLPR